jgi:hypothetical protein
MLLMHCQDLIIKYSLKINFVIKFINLKDSEIILINIVKFFKNYFL